MGVAGIHHKIYCFSRGSPFFGLNNKTTNSIVTTVMPLFTVTVIHWVFLETFNLGSAVSKSNGLPMLQGLGGASW